MSRPPKAFISYSQDSPEHAGRVRALADRLCGDGVDCIIDQYESHPREPWPRWMDRQIEEADFVLVVCTETYLRRAEGREKPGSGLGVTFESVLIVQDLYDAGMRNEKFIPVLFEGASAQSIPKPLRGYSRYRADTEDGYESLLRLLRDEPKVQKPEIQPGRPLPPASAPPLSSGYRTMAQPPEAFIHRQEYDKVLAALCPVDGAVQSASVGITTALRGAGGFGKTALAQAICQHARVKETYPDGILWTTMGEDIDANGRLARVRDLIRWWTREEAPAFETVTAAGARLRELLTGSRVLVVIDDVWSSADVTPFQGLGKGSAVLITTRDSQTLPVDSSRINVDAMEPSEAVSLLGLGLPEGFSRELQSLAARLGEWALLLKLVNRQLQELVKEDGLPIPKALREIEEALESQGFSAFDRDDKESRHAAASRAILVSVRRLPEEDRALYFQLAVFPEDAYIPLADLERFWCVNHFQTRKLCRRLHDLSLLSELDGEKETIRLHDVVRRVLIEQIEKDLPSLHSRLLDAFRPEGDAWADLSAEESYLWRNLSYHFWGAERRDELRGLLFDFSFLAAKLNATDVNTLIADYEGFAGEEKELRLIRDALRLSAHVLARDRQQLASQLYGRLFGFQGREFQSLLEAALPELWLRPKQTNLTRPGGPLIRTLEGHSGGVNAVAVVDGRQAVSGSSDGTLRIWDLQTGETLRTLKGPSRGVNAVAMVDGRRAVSGSGDGTLRVWDLETGETLRTLDGRSGGVYAVAVVDSRRAVSGSGDGTLRVWDLETGETLRTLDGHLGAIYAVAVVDGRRAVSASGDGTLRVWDFETGETLHTLEGHSSWVRTVAMVDGRRAVSSGDDGTLRVWDLETGETLRTLDGHSGAIDAVAVVDGRRAISGSSDGTLRIWDLETGGTLRIFEGYSGWVQAVAVVDGRRAISASIDRTLRVWDLETGETLRTPEGRSGWVTSVAVVDGRRAISSSGDRMLRVWDLETGEILRTLEGHSDWVEAVAVVDGRRAVSGSGDQTLRVWDLESGETLRTLEGHSGWVRAVAVVDGRRAVSGSDDWTLRVWDLESGEILRTLDGYSGVKAVAVVDGRRAVSGTEDWTLRVWDLETGETLRTLEGHSRWVGAVAVVDCRRAVSGSQDGTLRLWDLDTGETLQTLEGHSGWVGAVAVVDGRRAVSGSNDRTLRLWDLDTGEMLAVTTLDAPVSALATVPNGRIVVAGDQSGRVHFFDWVEPE
jgi:WD40 repeat protein